MLQNGNFMCISRYGLRIYSTVQLYIGIFRVCGKALIHLQIYKVLIELRKKNLPLSFELYFLKFELKFKSQKSKFKISKVYTIRLEKENNSKI